MQSLPFVSQPFFMTLPHPTTKALGNISLEGETNIRLYLWLLLVPFNSFTLCTTLLPITRCDKGWCKKITLKPIFQDNNSIQENIWYFLSRDKKKKKRKKKEKKKKWYNIFIYQLPHKYGKIAIIITRQKKRIGHV